MYIAYLDKITVTKRVHHDFFSFIVIMNLFNLWLLVFSQVKYEYSTSAAFPTVYDLYTHEYADVGM